MRQRTHCVSSRQVSALMLAAFLAVICGCTTNPITGRAQLAIVSSDLLESAAIQTYSQLLATPRAQGRVNSDAQMVQRVRGIADQLIQTAGRHYPHSRSWPWEVAVVDSKVMNAMCLPRGRIVVTTAIINELQLTDDEIAVLLGHEIGHAIAEHAAEKVSVQLVVNAGLQALMQQSRSARSAPQLTVALSQLLVTMPYGRTQEAESDHIGLVLAHESGYNIEQGWSLFEKMGRRRGGSTPEFLSTHPSHETRVEEIKELVPTVQAKWKSPGMVARAGATTTSISTVSASSLDSSRYRGFQSPDFSTEPKVRKPEGKWSFEAHKAVKAYQKCFLDRLELLRSADGVETYTIGCHDKTLHEVNCDSVGMCIAVPPKT